MSIKCQARSCVHNDDNGGCFARVVEIRGNHATVTDGTLCHSFAAEDFARDAEFAEEFNAAQRKATVEAIKCGAHGCRYNENRQCNANDVKINAITASCDTFHM